ncbi:hypothetical protein VNO77_02544 [Canavalia gladiata]|uniref:Uncharacterized protein n=1 Tax=Canavalia gladiata TaxID=3824 RepID=A0AAN9MT80_CANGL
MNPHAGLAGYACMAFNLRKGLAALCPQAPKAFSGFGVASRKITETIVRAQGNELIANLVMRIPFPLPSKLLCMGLFLSLGDASSPPAFRPLCLRRSVFAATFPDVLKLCVRH